MIIFSNGIRIIKKHIFQSLMILVIMIICFYLIGAMVEKNRENRSVAKKFEETYGNKTYYYTSESLSDVNYYNLCESNDKELYNRLRLFLNMLYNSKEFTFTSFSQQTLQITSMEIPEQFLIGFEEGYGNDSVILMESEILYSVKSIQVSSSYFKENNIEIIDGEIFDEDDYIYNKNKIIPVLLGGAYQGVLKIGDEFQGYYLCDKCNFKVKGFIGDNSFFFDKATNNMLSSERFMIIPSVIADVNDRFGSISLLDRINGFINSSIGYEETLNLFNQYLLESGISDLEIYMTYPGDKKSSNILETYSFMTKEVSDQFNVIVIVLLIFNSIINIIIICSMLRENLYVFGVEFLCGASLNNLTSEGAVVITILILTSDILASIILMSLNYSFSSLILVQIVCIIMMIISHVICALYVKNMKLNNYLGGKE